MSSPHFLQPLLRRSSESLALRVDGRTLASAGHLETAFDSASRKRGLLGRDRLESGRALIIAPCNMVHTIGMRFPIDIIFASRDGRIVKLRPGVPRWRIVGTPRAFAVIEMASGSITSAGLTVGQVLEVA